MKASAPGKIILFGEHAVVYGRPALAVPVTQVQAEVEIRASDDNQTWIEAPEIGLHSSLSQLAKDHPIAAVIHNFRLQPGIPALPPLRIKISSTIPVASGLGSGAAVSVALIRALAGFLQQPQPDEQVNALAYEIEKLHHGTPSGIDNSVVTYARPVYFIKGRPIETFSVGAPFTLVIGDTGIPAPTRESVGDVRKLWGKNKAKWEEVFDRIGEIVKSAREKIERGERHSIGALMNANHSLLQQLTVSSPELERLIESAHKAGALGAKLSGGGRGGNMIALVEKETATAVAEALHAAGAKQTISTEIR